MCEYNYNNETKKSGGIEVYLACHFLVAYQEVIFELEYIYIFEFFDKFI